jgi:ATP-dependent DNA helicase RecG
MSSAATATMISTQDPAHTAPEGLRGFASERYLSREEMLGAPVRWPRPSRLKDLLDVPPGKLADGLEALGLTSVGALLEHLPRDIREARTVAALQAGAQATVAVQVRKIGARPVRRRGMKPLVEATVFDATGSMRATFFNQPWLVQRYGPGTRLLLHGKADERGGFSVAHHALGESLGVGETDAPGEIAHYPATDGVSSTQILTLVQGVKDALAHVPEALSAATRVSEDLPDRKSALAAMHFPHTAEDREAGRERLAFEELLLTQLVFLRRRARRRESTSAYRCGEPPGLSERWLKDSLPFELTGDQRRAVERIREELATVRPMQRLLMGEVGSGKTVVALYAMLRAVEHGRQAALMAPTETLAEQHFATVQALLGSEQVSAALLTGSTPARRRTDILGKLESGELGLLVGTHALIEPDVSFRALAVAVVDEQHRFGVRQRAALDGKGALAAGGDGTAPHVLHMTATPIPRTLALARYGDLDVSVLRELPRGRQAIQTRIVAGEQARADAYRDLREQLDAGRQAFVVCPLVEESDSQIAQLGGAVQSSHEARAATAEFERLRRSELEGSRLVLLHGQMRSHEKQQAMAAFASGEADVLVTTTVIEVGIDVPNATVMLVENAERFGISQLHQLRGRIGRGEHQSMCFLATSHPPASSARLRALVNNADGFRLAEIDLELRSEGDLVGTRQSGLGRFVVACLPEDAALLERARERALQIVATDPELEKPEHALLSEVLEHAVGSEALEPIPA